MLGLWQEHGDEFLQWRQQPGRQHTTAGSEVARAPTADDSGLLLEIAAAGVDAQQMQQRMEGLQSYCHKLERSVRGA